MDLSVVWSLFYRYSQAFSGWLSNFFEQSYVVYFIYTFVHLFIFGTILIPLYIGLSVGKTEVNAQLLTEDSHLIEEIDGTAICFPNTTYARYAALYISLHYFVFFLLGTTLYSFMFIRMQIALLQSAESSLNVVLALMSLHDLLDYLIIIYFITPYRRTVLQWLHLADKQSVPTARVTFMTTTTLIQP
ncbi:hypothetical protein M3Y97_00667600 [Aphelenchoides bicaudatus]|nr:hypothetical protein M3Y97_00667600 [Aphelenchoides bicaudatus]